MKNLHVIAKLEDILSKWYGIDLFYVDKTLNIQSGHLKADYPFKNLFSKLQLNPPLNEFFTRDLESIEREIQDNETFFFASELKPLELIVSKISIEGEYRGFVLGSPFIRDSLTDKEMKNLEDQIKNSGAKEAALSTIKKIDSREREHLQDLIGLVAREVMTFHNEIIKREETILHLNQKLGSKVRYHNMIGKSPSMQEIYHLLEKISSSDSSVFIQGENGTGKELVAKAVHYNSVRKDKAFLAVNCSAFNENLLDSELFGHVKGSFTGAIKDKQGVFESAHGGTLFLDEIGDTSPSMQVKLLRVLQEGTLLPVGADRPKKVDVRIIAATNKNIKEMMKQGEFREDLFYRINVINIRLPSLKDRREDIGLLVDYFLQKRCTESKMPLKKLSKQCMERVFDYSWPGNIRELENEIERMVVLSGEEKMIQIDLLSPRIQEEENKIIPIRENGIDISGNLKRELEKLELLMIREGLHRCHFNKSKLARELGISRASLIMKVEKYNLDKRKKAVNE